MSWKQWTWGFALAVAAMAVVSAYAPTAYAQDEPVAEAAADDAATDEVVEEEEEAEEPLTAEALMADVDILWTCLAAFLVFFMQAGFALVECGFTRAKNACNIIMKNLMDFSIGSMLYWLIGFSIMFGTMQVGDYFAWGGVVSWVWDAKTENNFDWAFLIFQTVFAATAATIVSGAMAERTKFVGYLCYSILITAIVYPIFGSWAWNGLYSDGGWLEAPEGGILAAMGLPFFNDFAGSTVVHSIGGWCALAGAIVIGARIGKYGKDGRVNPIPGHNIPMGALGVFILWLGWFGFNPGSTTAVGGGSLAMIAVTTNLAAASGAIGAMIVSWIAFKKPDPSLSLNGALAGLVGITAGCASMTPVFSALTGLIAGVIVVGSIVFFDKVRVDDPVGAISVHGVCGAWGTLAVGLFMSPVIENGVVVGGGLFTTGMVGQLATQLIGIAAAFLWAFPTSLIIFLAIKYTIGLRVTQQEEIEGLDIGEHGMYAYPPALVADGMTSGAPTGHGSAAYSAPATSPAGVG